MSVPLPAMLVAIVIAPSLPASDTMSASSLSCLAFNTLCCMPCFLSSSDSSSDFSTDTVPTSIGCPVTWASFISSTTAAYFCFSVLNILSCKSALSTGLFVGIWTTFMWYIDSNSCSSVLAVPVIPDSFSYSLKKFWNVTVAIVLDSPFISTPSLASTASWSPSVNLLPCITLPVNSSTISISPSLTTYSTSKSIILCALRAWFIAWNISMFSMWVMFSIP